MRKGFYFTTSHDEVSQLFRAWVAISFAFAILLNRGLDFSSRFFALMLVAAVTVGIGFLLHEMSHKVMALRYGCRAEFRSFDSMLILAVIMSFFGFILAAPGAVFIQGRVNTAKNGIISAVGPLMNIFLAIIFSLVFVAVKGTAAGQVALYGMIINSWLALFNLIPFADLDGAKVFRWNKPLYFVLAAFSFVLYLAPYLLSSSF